MNIRAPEDRKSTSARVNWLLRMLKSEDSRIHIRANWPSRVQFTQQNILQLRQNPDAIQAENPKLVPVSFDVLLIEDTGGRFSGRKTFIEDIERAVPEFYEIVGQNLREWQRRPPKIDTNPVKHVESPTSVDAETNTIAFQQPDSEQTTSVTQTHVNPEVPDENCSDRSTRPAEKERNKENDM